MINEVIAELEEKNKNLREEIHALAFELDWCSQALLAQSLGKYTEDRCHETQQWLFNLESDGLYKPLRLEGRK
jgi:hypothetical protein